MTEQHDHAWTHDHVYLGAGHERAEACTRFVVYITAAFMAVEIAAGLIFGSMALLADGVHMATHVGAIGLAAWAYWMARRHASNPRFSFGSGKFGDLAAFASALILGIVSLAVAGESLSRLMNPSAISYREAIIVAALGLAINIVSAIALQDDHDDGHDHGHDHGHGHAHDEDDHAQTDHVHGHAAHADYNLRAAYVHVLADAATSVAALVALGLGAIYGWSALDPIVGLLGAFVIARWSIQLIQQAGLVLLDVQDNPSLAEAIRSTLKDDLRVQVADLHLWRLGPGHLGLIVSLVSPVACSADDIKAEIRRRHTGLSHVTVEIAVCETCAAQ